MESFVLEHKTTSYNSVEIKDERLNDSKLTVVLFNKLLDQSLQQWQKEGKFGIYLELKPQVSHLIQAAIHKGFNFHHAQPDYLMLTKWLGKDEDNSLPPGPHHFIGVGGIVLKQINPSKVSTSYEDFEILVIQEKSGPSANFKDFWKLPGGLVDKNENISKAIEREVFEETGIIVNFDKICCLRENHNGLSSMTRKSSTDLYLFCSLFLKNDSNFEITIQEKEIKAAKWMNLNNFLNSTIYKNKRDLYSILTRQAVDVALGNRTGLSYLKKRKEGGYLSKLDLASKL